MTIDPTNTPELRHTRFSQPPNADTASTVVESLIAREVAKAEQRGVAWTIGVVDELHLNQPDGSSLIIDRLYKGIKNTVRDRYMGATGIDPAPSYPVNVQLSPHTEQEEDQS